MAKRMSFVRRCWRWLNNAEFTEAMARQERRHRRALGRGIDAYLAQEGRSNG